MSRLWSNSDGQWEVLEGLLPPRRPVRGGARCGHRQVLGVSTSSSGVAWRGPSECYGPWRTVWERHRAWARDGALDAVDRALMTRAGENGGLDWGVGVDSCVVRAHQRGTNGSCRTGGWPKLWEPAR